MAFSWRIFAENLSLTKALPNITKTLNEELSVGAKTILESLKDATPTGATGSLKKAWKMSVTRINPVLPAKYVIDNSSHYFGVVEFGRKAGPISKEGMESLGEWVKKVIGVDGKEAKSVSFAIANSKKKKDTPGQFFAKEVALESVRDLIAHFKSAQFKTRITNILANQHVPAVQVSRPRKRKRNRKRRRQ